MANKKGTGITSVVYDLAKPVADSLGLFIWDVVYEKEGSLFYLRIFIEKEDGITIDDCEALSRQMSTILDEKDPIPDTYILEVGSPGLGRLLRKSEHFERFVECPVRIRYIREQNGVKEFIAVMTEYSSADNTITVVNEADETIVVDLSQTAFVKLCDDEDIFDDLDDSDGEEL